MAPSRSGLIPHSNQDILCINWTVRSQAAWAAGAAAARAAIETPKPEAEGPARFSDRPGSVEVSFLGESG